MSQLNLIEQFKESDVIDTANGLLMAVNSGSAKKDVYHAVDYFRLKDYYILSAENKQGQRIFNCLDNDGKVPKDFVVNWRTLTLVLHDIKHKKNATDNNTNTGLPVRKGCGLGL